MSTKYFIDLPNIDDLSGEWYEIAVFDTKEAAIAWAKKRIGAVDDEGRLHILSAIDDEEDEDEKLCLS